MKTPSRRLPWFALLCLGLTLSGCQSTGTAPLPEPPQPPAVRVPEEPASPPVPAFGSGRLIDLGTALAQAGVDNPTIELAREQVREATAHLTGASAMLLPHLTIGANVRIHEGNLQRASGSILDVTSESLYVGAGARAVGADTVAFPGVRLFAHLGDAFLEPRAARQNVGARTADAEAVQNRILLDVAVAYLELVGVESRIAALQAGQSDLAEVVRLTAAYAKSGEGRQADADRAVVNERLLVRQLQDAQGEADAASARLAGLLSLDTSIRLTTPAGPLAPVRLIDESSDLEPLVQQALEARPERVARAAELAEARTRVHQEHVRPWLPTLSVGFSAGGFGGGSDLVDPRFGKFNGRTDFDVLAVWNARNLLVGNMALRRQMTARTGEAVAAYQQTETDIGDEVAEAVAAARAASLQIEAARRQLATAQEGATEEMKRIRAKEARPLEVIDSVRQLVEARVELVRAITAFNVAQFRLWTALGLPPASPPAR
jgi:outer membrane protein TolC